MKMNTKKLGALCARKLQVEYARGRKRLIKELKKRQSPDEVRITIKESIALLNDKLSRIIALYTAKAFVQGEKDAKKEFGGEIRAAAPSASIGFDLNSFNDPALKKITHRSLGAIGKYNWTLSKSLILEYDRLLSNNRLSTSLKTHGYTPWLGESLKKKGISPEVISLIKKQSTSNKMLQVLNTQGIRGGMHPDQVGRRLEPYVNRYFGPNGVTLDNIGKTVKRIHVDADGNFEWRNHTVTRKYKATTRTYSRLIARDSMKQAHQDAYYESLQKTGLVDHYISVSVLDSRTCGNCSMMHGSIVTKGTGPQYHGNCHCDLKPVWRQDSLLGDKNKPESYYDKQRDRHFLAVDDLKKFNETMPSGSKLKHYTLLPEKARSSIMPGALQMHAIRNALLGEPAKIAPASSAQMTNFTADAWQMHAKEIYAKTAEDNVEYMRIFTTDGAIRDFKGTKHEVEFVAPIKSFSSIHTHPAAWDSPLSDTDMINFLSKKQELQMAASSSDNIYVMTKQKGWSPLRTSVKRNKFKRNFDLEVDNYLRDIDTSKYSLHDYHNAYLAAGKRMASEHGISYKVIPRRP